MTVTEEQRRIHARFQPAVEQAQAARASWLRTHMLPGEGIGSALRRRALLDAPRRRARLAANVAAIEFYRSHFALMRGRYDDGLHDDEWRGRNPHRAYRIRSIRLTDGCWWARGPAVLVVCTTTHDSLFVPAAGWAVDVHDADAWGAMIFAARDAHDAENAA